ncbi:hypothetical protein HN873_004231 [Arachis hypogaea]|uniref:Protein FAR1-RELATED SEQUENCE n=1 Tax=Arachis hypogaea TaxID=3818 RepID=A0A445EFZ7_ARAHY|nr:hypothetical protein Ahy_A02g009039 [Arachis hypogaea]
MDSSFELSGGYDDLDWVSEEEYFEMSSSSGDDEADPIDNDSDAAEMGDDPHTSGVSSDPKTCLGDAPYFRSTEDFIDKVFSTEEDAYAAYKQFARLRGFGVRKGDVARINGVLVRRDFFLSPAGYKA